MFDFVASLIDKNVIIIISNYNSRGIFATDEKRRLALLRAEQKRAGSLMAHFTFELACQVVAIHGRRGT